MYGQSPCYWRHGSLTSNFQKSISLIVKSNWSVAARCISTIHFMLIVACFLSLSVCYFLPSMGFVSNEGFRPSLLDGVVTVGHNG